VRIEGVPKSVQDSRCIFLSPYFEDSQQQKRSHLYGEGKEQSGLKMVDLFSPN